MASTPYKHLLLTDILTVAQVAVISYQTIPQYWCRKNEDATGKGGGCKCLGAGCAKRLLEDKCMC